MSNNEADRLAALKALFKDAMDWGRSYGQRLNLSDITVDDVSEQYAEKALAALAKQQAHHTTAEGWLPINTAPKDGSLLRLLVNFTVHNMDDDNEPQATVGMNNQGNTGVDEWQFAGWNWTHDRFTQGEGEPVGWLPMLGSFQATAVPVVCKHGIRHPHECVACTDEPSDAEIAK